MFARATCFAVLSRLKCQTSLYWRQGMRDHNASRPLAYAQVSLTEQDHPELLNGVRGAGASLGVVTQLTFKL